MAIDGESIVVVPRMLIFLLCSIHASYLFFTMNYASFYVIYRMISICTYGQIILIAVVVVAQSRSRWHINACF